MGGDPRRENNPNNNRKVTMDKKTMRSILLRLSRYILRYKWLFLLALCMMFASNIIALAGPKISGNAIDALTELTGNEMVAKVGGYCLLLAILYTISSILSYALSATMIYLSQKSVYTMRKQVFDHLTTLPVNYFDTHATGDIISRISYDIDTVNTTLSHDLLQIGASLVTIIGSLIMMLSISPLLILVFVITVPLSIFFTKQKTKDTGVTCPDCGGKIVMRFGGKRRSAFYSCENYPTCQFSSWMLPTAEKCPKCGKTMFVNKSKNRLVCGDKSCGYVGAELPASADITEENE